KATASLSIDRCATARSAMLSTTLPSLIVCGGTRTPGRVASTSRCGVIPLSEIHSYSARNRYGRWLVMRTPVSGMPASLGQRAQVALLRGQAACETRIAEDAVAVVLDRLAVLR